MSRGVLIGSNPGSGGSGGAPSGAAGGELAGTYPNPSIADGKIDDANIVAAGLTNAAISATAAIAPSKLAAIPESGITNLTADLAAIRPQLAAMSRPGALTVLAGVARFYFPQAVTILGVSMAVNTAPTGASLICDINKNGTTIFTTQGNRPAIAISGNAVAEGTAPDVTAYAAGDYLTVDVDQVGSTIAGSDLTVMVRWRWT